jgi:hypothetical protein
MVANIQRNKSKMTYSELEKIGVPFIRDGAKRQGSKKRN